MHLELTAALADDPPQPMPIFSILLCMTNSYRYFYKIVLHAIFPLIAGCVIYLYGRHDTWLNIRLSFPPIWPGNNLQNHWWGRILIYNFPDLLWDYSFASALFIWNKWTATGRKCFPIAVFLLLIISETIQTFLPGIFTFDWLDMLATVLAFFMSFLLNRTA